MKFRTAFPIALGALILAGASAKHMSAQQAVEAPTFALPLAEDRGQAAIEQDLRRLATTARVMMIVAHPDDEDGALLTYLSRGLGAGVTLFTLTRGEGGQNAMSADGYDALGLIRTNELLRADEFYGVKQLWGTEADFGFSKTQEESFIRWGHDRVLFDAVLAVRRERPQIIVSTFVGGITDGHGHHQVSGEIAQEVFKAAGDATVFPEQLKDGLQTWQPSAVYSMVPFARVEDGKMFDYATGKWAPTQFKNFVTGEWTTSMPSADVTIQVGTRDLVLGRSYAQIAREGWGQQKTQNGGGNPELSGPANTNYHLWAVTQNAAARQVTNATSDDLFQNSKVEINRWFAGLNLQTGKNPPVWLTDNIYAIDAGIRDAIAKRSESSNDEKAHQISIPYRKAIELYSRLKDADSTEVDAKARENILFELNIKIDQFQTTLADILGLDLAAFTTHATKLEGGGLRGASSDETPRSVSPGEKFNLRLHTSSATPEARLNKVSLMNDAGEVWPTTLSTNSSTDSIFEVTVPETAKPTQPYFTRPSIEQSYYDVADRAWRERSFEPYPLTASAEFIFDGLPIYIRQTVQTMQRVTGAGGIYEPLVVTPSIGIRMEPEARILPLDGSSLPVRVTVHAQAAADGTVELKLPTGWRVEPTGAKFHLPRAGDTEPIMFSVTPVSKLDGNYTLQAIAHSGGKSYEAGWRSVGYAGLRPYNIYRTAELKTRKVDVKLATGLKIGYVMGTGDLVPEAIEGMGIAPQLLTTSDLTAADLLQWNVIVIGIRAYSMRPELTLAQSRLDEFVRRGGTLIVQYQSGNFPAPLRLSMKGMAERVVDEQAAVKLLEPDNSLLHWPNTITSADFDGWIEERGHSFMDSWDPGYTALTETADVGQDPQRGGLLVAHPGKGSYIYVSFALYRQLPELVPGAYRILANLLSAGHE
jgi:LmbE family N-acetylglucosaminyl deacetylase